MIDLSKKTACVIDNGTTIEVAIRLSKDFGKVYYTTLARDAFARMNKEFIGVGIENIHVISQAETPGISDIWDLLDEIDIFVFPDINFGELQLHLESLGKRVFGSRDGEQLENDRIFCKEAMEEVDLAVLPYKTLIGTEALREYLKKHDNVWIKISKFRGIFETFKSKNYRISESELDRLDVKLGPFRKTTEFIVEDDFPDSIEIAYDGPCVDGIYASKSLIGVEVKDLGYIARFLDNSKFPKEVTEWNSKMSSYFKNYRYRNFIGPEIRINKKRKSYMTDFAARHGNPPSPVYMEFYSNYSEFIWLASEGKLIDLIPYKDYEWAAQVSMTCVDASKYETPLEFPDKIRQFVKLKYCTKRGKTYSIIPQFNEDDKIGDLIGMGKTLEDAFEMIEENAKLIESSGVDFNLDAIDLAIKEMDKIREFGFTLYD